MPNCAIPCMIHGLWHGFIALHRSVRSVEFIKRTRADEHQGVKKGNPIQLNRHFDDNGYMCIVVCLSRQQAVQFHTDPYRIGQYSVQGAGLTICWIAFIGLDGGSGFDSRIGIGDGEDVLPSTFTPSRE
jgi:hypothetical protein